MDPDASRSYPELMSAIVASKTGQGSDEAFKLHMCKLAPPSGSFDGGVYQPKSQRFMSRERMEGFPFLPWHNAPPICQATIKLVASATRGWHHTSHWLHHPRVRGAVFATLVVAERLDLHEKAGEAARGGGAGAGATISGDFVDDCGADVPLLPVLPPEIWLVVMGFFLRSWWAPRELHAHAT